MSVSVTDMERVIHIVQGHSNRPRATSGNPGGLVDLSQDSKPAIVIGDLHGAVDNFRAILNHGDNRRRLQNGEVRVIIIGDGVHNDQTGQMRKMESSLLVLEELFRLILAHNEDVLYLRGNHDTFDAQIAKSGIKQGLEFKQYLQAQRGDEYVAVVERFFDALPVFVIGKGYVVTHAGPIRHGCCRRDLIDIENNPDFYRQLLWNRLHEFRGNPSLKEYGEDDIRNMIEKLDLSLDTFFIVGHNPMWHTGNETGIWRDIIGIKNHIIIYSNLQTRGPYLRLQNGQVQAEFAIPETQVKFYA